MTNNYLETCIRRPNEIKYEEPLAHKDLLGSNPYLKNTSEDTDLLHSKSSSVPFSSNASDSLFTSPELLAECRNFLKLKSSAKPSVEKDSLNNRIHV